MVLSENNISKVPDTNQTRAENLLLVIFILQLKIHTKWPLKISWFAFMLMRYFSFCYHSNHEWYNILVFWIFATKKFPIISKPHCIFCAMIYHSEYHHTCMHVILCTQINQNCTFIWFWWHLNYIIFFFTKIYYLFSIIHYIFTVVSLCHSNLAICININKQYKNIQYIFLCILTYVIHHVWKWRNSLNGKNIYFLCLHT